MRQTGTRDRCLNYVIAVGFRVGLQRAGRRQFLGHFLLSLLRLMSSFRGKGSRYVGQVCNLFRERSLFGLFLCLGRRRKLTVIDPL